MDQFSDFRATLTFRTGKEDTAAVSLRRNLNSSQQLWPDLFHTASAIPQGPFSPLSSGHPKRIKEKHSPLAPPGTPHRQVCKSALTSREGRKREGPGGRDSCAPRTRARPSLCSQPPNLQQVSVQTHKPQEDARGVKWGSRRQCSAQPAA